MIAVVVGGFRSLGSRRGLRSRARLALARRARAGAVRVQRAHARTARSSCPSVTDKGTVSLVVNRNVDLLFLIDDSSSMRLSQDNLRRNFPALHDRAQESARRPAQRPHRGHLVGHGRRRRLGRRLRCERRQERHLPVHAARRLHGDRPRRRRDVHLRRRAACGTTPATSRTCSPASPRWARRAAASSTSSPRSRARSAPTARPPPAENQGFLRPDAYLAIVMITNEDDCSALAGRAALRHQLEHDHRRRSSARPRTSAATSSATSATACTPIRHAPNDDVERHGHYNDCVSADGRLRCSASRTPPNAASRRSRPIRRPDHGRGDHRASRRRTPCTGRRRAPTRRAATPARGRRSPTPAWPPTAASPIPSPRISELVQRVRRRTACSCRSAAASSRPRSAHRRQDRRSHPQALHHRARSRRSRGRRSTTAR